MEATVAGTKNAANNLEKASEPESGKLTDIIAISGDPL